jgi:hypothetical protein
VPAVRKSGRRGEAVEAPSGSPPRGSTSGSTSSIRPRSGLRKRLRPSFPFPRRVGRAGSAVCPLVISSQVPLEVRDELLRRALAADRSLSVQIRLAIRAYIERKEDEQ